MCLGNQRSLNEVWLAPCQAHRTGSKCLTGQKASKSSRLLGKQPPSRVFKWEQRPSASKHGAHRSEGRLKTLSPGESTQAIARNASWAAASRPFSLALLHIIGDRR
ncbi:hypothetical protein HRR83_001726 [Exophiala dermatitidis]|uniref:Uncharacterized protein n=1 Tax=Exophiala dermatitidis TaxID=5970 RepID=A0AAN6IXK2_EXODE|nr:hypothetical protein HRR73_004860 [Exophiala dermatitidis]KAJ4526532.1 hypothetical protein HRR74_001730 [Exophiala dermatitidis]KAJ4570506.1 hypothetical protein HRR81_005934 [Exophiala dermatitidis]KAJ4594640.1 hypothetical protein HRR84_005912 [Exophiala dermatitidis]KAJ4605759.1 hypothetical protein HRR83_001726 [Exophiala dermatitidis]